MCLGIYSYIGSMVTTSAYSLMQPYFQKVLNSILSSTSRDHLSGCYNLIKSFSNLPISEIDKEGVYLPDFLKAVRAHYIEELSYQFSLAMDRLDLS